MNSMGGTNCISYVFVLRQFAFNTDPGGDSTSANAEVFFTNWFMLLEPEQQKYTATLTVEYADPARSEDAYVFIPALRRYQALSASALMQRDGRHRRDPRRLPVRLRLQYHAAQG